MSELSGIPPGHPAWLPALLRCHAAMDHAVSLALTRRPGLACGPGCSCCCLQPVPASIPELAGALWRLRTACDERTQKAVRLAMRSPDLNRCPFLVNSRCCVYPLRFLACREYGVYTSPCRPGEDPWTTRQGDLLRADPERKRQAFALLTELLGRRPAEPAPLDTLRAIVMDASPPVQMWRLDNPEIYPKLMDKGPPLPDLRNP